MTALQTADAHKEHAVTTPRTVCSCSAGESPALGFFARRGNTTRFVLYAFSRLAFSCGSQTGTD